MCSSDLAADGEAPRANGCHTPLMALTALGGTPVNTVGDLPAVGDTCPAFSVTKGDLSELTPADLAGSREKLYLFLSGWLGGPPLYAEKFGHPMLRARHLPFAIGLPERDAWLACMKQAMADCEIEAGLKMGLMNSLFKTADWMRNKEG